MEHDEEHLAIINRFAEEFGITVEGGEAVPFSISIHDEWDLGEMIDRLGKDASLFRQLTPCEKALAYSIKIYLSGTGLAFNRFIKNGDKTRGWTAPQQEIVAKAADIFDKRIIEAEKSRNNILDFFYLANRVGSVKIPAWLQDTVCQIRLTPPGYENITLDADRSYAGATSAREIMEDVLKEKWRIATVTFVTENGDEIGTNGPVAWPVEHDATYLTELFSKLVGVAGTSEAGGSR